MKLGPGARRRIARSVKSALVRGLKLGSLAVAGAELSACTSEGHDTACAITGYLDGAARDAGKHDATARDAARDAAVRDAHVPDARRK